LTHDELQHLEWYLFHDPLLLLKSGDEKNFDQLAIKQMFVTAFHSKEIFSPEQRVKVHEWGLKAARSYCYRLPASCMRFS